MFKKNLHITFDGATDNLLSLHPQKDLPKKTNIEIPQGYHLILMNKDGTSELIQNQYNHVTKDYVMYVYYVKHHQGVHRSKWGTRSRIDVMTHEGDAMTLGGYGTLEWRIVNPIQLITRRLIKSDEMKADDIAQLLLDKLPNAFQSVLEGKTIDPSDLSDIKQVLKKTVEQSLNDDLNSSGIQIEDFIIESINLQPKQEEE